MGSSEKHRQKVRTCKTSKKTHQFQHPCRGSTGSKTTKGAQENNDSACANEHKRDIGGLLI